MRLALWTDANGFLDQDFRDGDIVLVQPDTWEPGDKEKKQFLIVQTEDMPGDWSELVKQEYAPSPAGDLPDIRRKRKYRVDYAARFTPDVLAQVKDPDTPVEPVTGMFTLADISRK